MMEMNRHQTVDLRASLVIRSTRTENSVLAVFLSVRPWPTENSVGFAYLSVRADGSNMNARIVSRLKMKKIGSLARKLRKLGLELENEYVITGQYRIPQNSVET